MPPAHLRSLPPGELLAQFQAAHPVWARWIAGLLMLFTGMSVGRLTVRYNLYSVGTCLAIPLYGAIACGLAVGGDCLTTFAASALLALATKNFCRSYCNGFGFDAIFRASLYIGLLPLVATAAAPLLILLPLAVMLFRRTLREVAVAVAGLLLPALTLCYVNWGRRRRVSRSGRGTGKRIHRRNAAVAVPLDARAEPRPAGSPSSSST